jgi:hypothetical protein
MLFVVSYDLLLISAYLFEQITDFTISRFLLIAFKHHKILWSVMKTLGVAAVQRELLTIYADPVFFSRSSLHRRHER